MSRLSPWRLGASVCALAAPLIVASPAHADLYKCPQPDGRVTYQQTACGGRADVESFEVDVGGPAGSETSTAGRDYSVAGQAASMQAEREQRSRARRSAKRAAAPAGPRPDAAKCAKHRAEVARWKEKVMQGYRKRTEKDYNQGQLEHHQALAERFCD
jgi:hypothetical protein